MVLVQRIDGSMVEHVQLTDIKHVGDEGDRTAIAHIDGQTYPVFNSIIDGFNNIWVEQMSMEDYKARKAGKAGEDGYAE